MWGIPTLTLILCVGIFVSFCTGFAQITLFLKSIKSFFQQFRQKGEPGQLTPYQALCTALAATVGTGNIAGVAGAISLGGPGAIFWMWVCAFFGMAIKYAEATLALFYRQKNRDGEYVGGPMYMIREGLPKRLHWLAGLYSFFGVVAAFGVGNATQVNAVIDSMTGLLSAYQIPTPGWLRITIGMFLALVIGGILLGGAKRIGTIAQALVPFASVLYILISLFVLGLCCDRIPVAFQAILQGAFSPRAVTGGFVGSIFTAVRVGSSRGIFTNEAGMGTASIAHASAQVSHPAQQGLMGIMEVFIDTVVICTLTALVILCSGISVPYGMDAGAELTSAAFSSVLGDWVRMILTAALCAFAVATVLGWGLYGLRCAQYLFGDGVWKRFVYIQIITVIVSSALRTGTVWLIAETVNGLMAIPNLIALLFLSRKLAELTKTYKNMIGRKSAVGGTYEDIHQRKPLRTLTYAEIPPSGRKGKEGWQENISPEHRSA